MYTHKYVFQHAYVHTHIDKTYMATCKKFLTLGVGYMGEHNSILSHFFLFLETFHKTNLKRKEKEKHSHDSVMKL